MQNKCSAEQDPSSSALVSGREREGLPLSWAGENKAPLAPQPGQQALCMGESSSKGAPVVPWGWVIAAAWQERCAGQEKVAQCRAVLTGSLLISQFSAGARSLRCSSAPAQQLGSMLGLSQKEQEPAVKTCATCGNEFSRKNAGSSPLWGPKLLQL